MKMLTVRTRLFPLLTLTAFLVASQAAAAQDGSLLDYAQPVEGRLGAAEADTYRFQAETGDRVLVTMTAAGGEMDPFLQLYDPQGRLIAEDDNGAGKYDAQIDGVIIAEAGTYTVTATNRAGAAPGGTMGEYGLIINEAGQIIAFHGGGVVANVPDGGLLASPGVQNYELSQPWDTNEIGYTILNTLPGFSEADIRTVIEESFAAWAQNSPLTFFETDDPNAHIVIQFGSIDGSSNVLGQACPPSSPCAGQVEFDLDENWTLREPQFFNDISFLAVATHEFGHALGLLHSNDPAALMYPQYSPYNLQPADDDIAGLQRLYGRGTGTVLNPTPQPGAGASSGDVVVGTITDSAFVHYWDFDVTAGEPVTLTMQSAGGGLDPFLVLLDFNDNVLAFDDDGGAPSTGGLLDAQLRNIAFPETGTYTVAATRYLQAQGGSTGEYQLSITYGRVADPASAASPTGQPSGSVNGGVRVAFGDETALSSAIPLESVLTGQFADSLTPTTQTLTGRVSAGQTYAWSHTWCAASTRALDAAFRSGQTTTFSVNGRATPASNVNRVFTERDGLFCATDYVLLNGWEGDRIRLSVTMTLPAPVFDGFNVYDAGDYVYVYDLAIE